MQRPVPESIMNKFEPTDQFVSVDFETSYRCKLCQWKPRESWGCIQDMGKHLFEVHGIKPKEGMVFWFDAPSEADIQRGLELLYKTKSM